MFKNPKNLDFDSKNSNDVPINLNEFLDEKLDFLNNYWGDTDIW